MRGNGTLCAAAYFMVRFLEIVFMVGVGVDGWVVGGCVAKLTIFNIVFQVFSSNPSSFCL